MKHISIDDIFSFVMADEFNVENIEMINRVNQHIIRCEMCRKKVRAFQTIYDEMMSTMTEEELKSMSPSIIEKLQNNISKRKEAQGGRTH